MSNNTPICTIFSSILKVASMIETIFSLNGGLLIICLYMNSYSWNFLHQQNMGYVFLREQSLGSR